MYWLSFVKNNKFSHIVIIDEEDFIRAIKKSWELGINPGGEVHGTYLSPEESRILIEHTDKIIYKNEANKLIEALGCLQTF